MRPTLILVHRCETGHTGAEVDAAEAQAHLGYHFFVRRNGIVDCMHDWSDEVVWHACSYSRGAFGVAVEGDFVPSDKSRDDHPTLDQLTSLTSLCLALWAKWGPLPILGHTDLIGASKDPKKVCPGENLDVRMLQAEVYSAYFHDQLYPQSRS